MLLKQNPPGLEVLTSRKLLLHPCCCCFALNKASCKNRIKPSQGLGGRCKSPRSPLSDGENELFWIKITNKLQREQKRTLVTEQSSCILLRASAQASSQKGQTGIKWQQALWLQAMTDESALPVISDLSASSAGLWHHHYTSLPDILFLSE